jgi:hypothetical protein
MNVFTALAFVHLFWCYHGEINFVGWHYPYVKLY